MLVTNYAKSSLLRDALEQDNITERFSSEEFAGCNLLAFEW